MFVQVFHGPVEGDVRGVFDRWQRDLAPKAQGFRGGVAGVTDDGELVSVVRFDSEEDARRNSERAEQGEWWAELEAHFTEEPGFAESTDVELFLDGPTTEARFVQVIQGRVADRQAWRSMMSEAEGWLREHRPEVRGGFVAWHDEGRVTEVVYFTDEASAREGERRMDEESPVADGEPLLSHERYLDLRDVWILEV